VTSLFDEPISVNGGMLGGGQHHVCAMKLANVLMSGTNLEPG
jgi:hypothetical protein